MNIKQRTLNNDKDSYILAVVLALFVTFLWSTSFIIIKIGLISIPPLLFSGLRYLIASILLFLYIIFSEKSRVEIKKISVKNILLIVLYGIVFILLTQGSMFLSLKHLDAITVSLFLTLTPIVVLIIATLFLHEIHSKIDLIFIFLALIGVFIFFYPFLLPHAQILGIIFLIGTLLFNSISTILGRFLNAQKIHSPLIITAISMLFGSIGLVFVSFLTELPHFITDIELIYIIILAFFNTALAFTLWNKAMRSLRAIDISLINNTMLPQITILSFVFLHENMNLLEFIGLSISFVTIMVLQVHNAIKEKNKTKQFENLK